MLEHWSAFFDDEAYLPDGAWSQDLILLRRRADGAPPTSPPIVRRPDVVAAPSDVATAPKPWSQRVVATALRVRRRLIRAWQRRGAQEPVPDQSAPASQDLVREIGMLRTGVYEQGQRISVLAERLRDEIPAIGSIDGHK